MEGPSTSPGNCGGGEAPREILKGNSLIGLEQLTAREIEGGLDASNRISNRKPDRVIRSEGGHQKPPQEGGLSSERRPGQRAGLGKRSDTKQQL